MAFTVTTFATLPFFFPAFVKRSTTLAGALSLKPTNETRRLPPRDAVTETSSASAPRGPAWSAAAGRARRRAAAGCSAGAHPEPGNTKGDPGNDLLLGAQGNDTLEGGIGQDAFQGGSGTDIATYAIRWDPVRVSINDVADDGMHGERDNVRSDVERVIGGHAADTLVGNAASQVFWGGDGKDVIEGGGSRDFL